MGVVATGGLEILAEPEWWMWDDDDDEDDIETREGVPLRLWRALT